jgi:hypothetical protein
MGLFKLGEAFRELTDAVGAKDTAIAGAKLVGKTLFNTGKMTFDAAVAQTERQSEQLLKRDDLDEEKRQKLEGINRNSKRQRIRIQIKKLEEEIEDNEKLISEEYPSSKAVFDLESSNRSLQYEIDKLQRELESIEDD